MQEAFIDHGWRRFLVATGLTAAAAALRLWPLQALGTSLVWLTFYPAVMVAAIHGGLGAGLLVVGLACLTAVFLGPWLVGAPFIDSPSDWLGMGVFILNGTLMSWVAEAMRRANARARRAQKQAESANRSKSIFLATMSHELRTPLNAILGFSDLMRTDPLASPGQRENLDIINRSGQHLLSLINEVLDMAKIEAGQLVVNPKPFDAGALVREMADMLRLRAEEKGLELWVEQAPDFPRFLLGDEEKLRQVLINLIGNAIKFTQQGGVTLRLAAKENGTEIRILIDVEDTGIGIPEADQDRIFEPFVQVGRAGSQKGTGLGLAITREMVQLMGGTIRLKSTPGKGSAFQVEVPMGRASEAEVQPPVSPKGRVVGLEPGQPEFRILIVEDQVENQLLLRRLLEDVGLKVRLAQNGAEGVALFQAYRPHLIWMDRRMPIMDGMDATRRIRALEGGRAVKIVAVSASVYSDELSEMLSQGVDDFVRKPFRPADIFDCLERNLGVRFTYAAPDALPPAPTLSAAALGALPKPLRRSLSEALLHGDTRRIASLKQQIAQQNPALAKAMAPHLDRFDYLPILEALDPEVEAAQEVAP